jgi:hypothetical protein
VTTVDPGVVIAGIIAIIAAISTAAVAIIGALRSTKDVVVRTAQVNAEQSRKLDTITVLVDGSLSDVLQELADVKLAISTLTGLEADRVKAEDAQKKADKQSARVKEVEKTAHTREGDA